MGTVQQVLHKRFERFLYEERLQVKGWTPQQGGSGSEALIHIHGYNSATQHGIKNIAQLWSLASFPGYIKPIVFSWPTGKLFAYPWAQTKGAESVEVAKALRDLIISLAASGVRDFHFQTHSMGARLLMFALPYVQDLFDPQYLKQPATKDDLPHVPTLHELELTPSEYSGRLRLVNVVLMNPEYGLHQFVKTRSKLLERICDITTVYGDLKDTALTFSYVMNNMQNRFMKHHSNSWLPREVTASQPCRCIWKQRDTCLGLHIYDVKDEEGKPALLDMIDCTFLESNVQGGRHNAFTLNRSVIEDIYDVVVNRRPAIQRGNRLEPRGGNVFSFLVAPSHVVAP
uniref:Transmembrane protein n=1 Tax=Tetraselmis sp. GSL018 TaxID=582737 RepID=A0A061RFK2_9CHLO